MNFRFALATVVLIFVASSAGGQAPATGLTVDYVAVHPELWPKQVITKEPVQMVIRPDGAAPTTVTLPAGQLMKLMAVEGGNVRLEFQGSSVTVPAAQTDLLTGAATAMARLSAASRPPAPPAPPPGPEASANPPGPRPPAGPVQNPLAKFLRGGLVAFRSDTVVPVTGDPLAGKRFVALYFATRSKSECQVFTQKLKQFYATHRRDSEKFEIVFVPTDNSAKEMAYHIRENEMPWLAVDFARQELVGGLRQQFGGSEVPNLVVLDENGSVVVSGFDGKTFVGAQKAMADFGQLLDRN